MLACVLRGTIETCDELILYIFFEQDAFFSFLDVFWLAVIFSLGA